MQKKRFFSLHLSWPLRGGLANTSTQVFLVIVVMLAFTIPVLIYHNSEMSAMNWADKNGAGLTASRPIYLPPESVPGVASIVPGFKGQISTPEAISIEVGDVRTFDVVVSGEPLLNPTPDGSGRIATDMQVGGGSVSVLLAPADKPPLNLDLLSTRVFPLVTKQDTYTWKFQLSPTEAAETVILVDVAVVDEAGQPVDARKMAQQEIRVNATESWYKPLWRWFSENLLVQVVTGSFALLLAWFKIRSTRVGGRIRGGFRRLGRGIRRVFI